MMTEGDRKRNIGTLILVVLGIAFVVAAVAAAPFSLMMAVFPFDAPGSSENPITWALAGGSLMLPVALLATGVLAILAPRMQRARTRAIVLLAPLTTWGIYMALTLTLLETLCQGLFACPN